MLTNEYTRPIPSEMRLLPSQMNSSQEKSDLGRTFMIWHVRIQKQTMPPLDPSKPFFQYDLLPGPVRFDKTMP